MTKQEEIRGGAERLLQELHDIPAQQSHEILDGLFKYLHSVDVVIQVVPDDSSQIYRAVKPLIKEVSNGKGLSQGV